MKVNELSIGDWVQAHMIIFQGEERLTPPMRVVALGETLVRLQIDPESGDPDEYDIKDIRPVPLTVDILLANEWEHLYDDRFHWESGDGDNNIADAEEMLDGGIRIEIDNLRLPVFHVHNLQHALRLAGIEKEIEL